MVVKSVENGEMSNSNGDKQDREIVLANEVEEDDNEEDDSDKELQIALKEGLLKSDKLNYIVEKKRPIINKKAEMVEKIETFKKKLPWLETMDITVSNKQFDEKAINDDFEREIIFYKQAEKAVQIAIPRLHELNIKVFRPKDYYAEMVKSDQHMQKVRQRLADLEESKQRQEAIRRIREEKKFAAKVQKEVTERKQAEKKFFLESMKQHRKGIKSQLDVMLNSAKRLQITEGEESFSNEMKSSKREKPHKKLAKKKFSRVCRDRKYGFGGQKKRSKKNNKDSFDEIVTPRSLSRKLKGQHFSAHTSKRVKHKKQRRKG